MSENGPRGLLVGIGPSLLSKEEFDAAAADLESEWDADAYHVFDKNCVHFSGVLAEKVCEKGLPQPSLPLPPPLRGIQQDKQSHRTTVGVIASPQWAHARCPQLLRLSMASLRSLWACSHCGSCVLPNV